MATFEWPKSQPAVYRLYYNNDGTPKCYTMEDLAGKYIEVDRETYIAHLWNVRVVDEKLQIIPLAKTTHKLKPNSNQGTCCSVKDVCVVVESYKPHIKWNMTINETY